MNKPRDKVIFRENDLGNEENGYFWTKYEMMELGMPSFQKSAVFLNIVQKAFDPPPLYLNICPILQGVFFKRVFEHMIWYEIYVAPHI